MNIKMFDADSLLYELLSTLRNRNQSEISLRNQSSLMKVAVPPANNISTPLVVTTAACFDYRHRNSGKYRSGLTPAISNKKWMI